ncbi:MAG: winged helix-turn-helix transcriptional regulator [Micromonosporaceae bacterium]
MLHSRYPDQVCSIARTLEVIGERWSLLIVRDALAGLSRFEEFQRSLGVARNVLSARLEHLVAEGVLARTPYGPSGRRQAYRLTDKGRELATPVIALMSWGDRHYLAPGGPPRQVEHAGCGGEIEPRLVCADDGRAVGVSDVKVLPGPGWPHPHD